MVHALLRKLIDLDLPQEDYALFGSGPLLVRGWIQDVGDLDVFARNAAWEKAVERGNVEIMADGAEIIQVGEGVTFLPTWPFGPATIDTMIDTAEVIDGIPCVRLEYLIAYMELFDRPKDRERLAIIEVEK